MARLTQARDSDLVTPKPARSPNQTLQEIHEFPISRSLGGRWGAGQSLILFFPDGRGKQIMSVGRQLYSDPFAVRRTSNCAYKAKPVHQICILFKRSLDSEQAWRQCAAFPPLSWQTSSTFCLGRLGADLPASGPASTPKSDSRGTAHINMGVTYKTPEGWGEGHIYATYR